MNGEMNGVMPNGRSSVVEDDTGFIPFQPAVPMEDVEEHAHFLVLAWALLLYRSSTESAFTSGFYDIVSEERTATTSTSGFTADIVSRTIEPVSKALGRVRDQSVIKPREGCDGPTTMFFTNAGSQGQDSDLSIHMEARVSEGQLWVRHSQRPPIARRMAMLQVDAYMDILNSVLVDQEQMCAQAMRLRESELAQLWQWNTPLAPRIDTCMHDLFVEQARKQPDNPAVVSWDGQLTYGELDALSTRLAGRLAALGAGVGTIIPLCFEKSVWMSVALIGVMKSGSAFSLTDPSQPEARLRVIAEEVGARVVITSESKADLGARVAPEGATVLTVGPRMLKEKEEESSWEPVAVPSSATLYVIFTSGSTGKPKGIEISHANYSSGAVPRGDIVGYRPHSRVLDFASYAFDVSIDCMLCTLSTGGVICVPSEEQRMNDLGGAIETMDANMAHMTPSVARVLDPEVMDRLEVLGLGGEAVSARDAASWSQRTRPVICYGPSECTVACTVNGDVAPGRTSIGKGCGGATWICDPEDHGRLVPVGAVGELLVEGPLVGKGYLNQPDKTAEVFIEDPPWLVAGGRRGRLYKTGDLVRYDGDGSGNIVFVGRKDAQVKLRGQRVELGEVEFHVCKHMPAGTNVAAEVVRPSGGEPSLVCFVATNSSNPDSFPPALAKAISGLDEALARDLPIYMLPSAYIPIERLPTLVSLKVDRKRLRELGAALTRPQLAKLRAAATEQREPTTPTECCLHRLWTDLFGEDAQVGVMSNFFALGGDSLAAMRLVAAARKEGLALGVADVFARPRLQDMARVVGCLRPDAQVPPFSLLPKGCDAEDARAHAADRCSILRTRIEDVYPCTPLQEGLMALSAKVQSAYVAQRVVQLPDLPTAYRLRDAFNEAAQECHILRTRIIQLPGHGLMQVVVRGDLPWTSTSGSVESYLDQDRADEMGLGTPLVRLAMVADYTSGSVDVVLTIHHALYDGWSMPLVIDRVNRAYRRLETNRAAPFRQFIHHLDAMDRETSRKYWEQQLTGAGGPQFPALPFQGYQTSADALLERYITLPQKRATNTTLATAIRGAWALVAAQYTTDDVVFGETLTGRNANITGVEEIEGPMITTVPLRVHVDGRAPASVYLQTIHRDTVERIPHEHFGLQHIRRLHRDAREACELRTGLIMHPTAEPEPADQPAREDEPALGFMPANDVEAAREALKFNSYALMLVCSLDPNGFLVMASFDQKTLSVARAEKALEQLEQAVQRLCEDGDVLVGDIDCVAAPGTYCTEQPKSTPAPKFEQQPRRDSGAVPAQPTTEKQLKLRSLWSRALGIPETEIDTEANFFDLGGDSIAAMKLVSEARLEGLRVTVADIFKTRQFLDLADVVQELPDEGRSLSISPKPYTPFSLLDAPLNAIKPQIENPEWNIVDVLPARPLQEIAVKGTTTLPRYSARYELMYLDDAVDKHHLFASCQELVARNEILRTVFVEHDSRCYGAVLEQLQAPVVEYRTDANLPAFAQSLCHLDVQTLMPLGSSFVKFFFIQSATTSQSCLILRISHAQYDEICLPTLLRQLSALYEHKPLEPTLPFSLFTAHILRTSIPASTAYWRDLLRGSSMSVLRPAAPLTSTTPVFLQRTVDISTRDKSTTLATLPSAAWALTLARRLGTRDVTFGEVATGRAVDGFPHADRVVGPCWQYIPTRVVFEPGWTPKHLLDFVQAQHIASAGHACMGLTEIVAACTDWPRETDWFDSVVHLDVDHVEELPFTGVKARMETVYPHLEPLREWKVQAFPSADGESVTMEIVAREAWVEEAQGLLDGLESAIGVLVGKGSGVLFD
ncbi:Nonribosomal peptide synthetase 4 [Lasiodiplodia theobromae]|uniref:Nonribosomal peptide synthetase 4 n=1 Tax=Lasiodiplodia theobromae TaxID=45133 RepID=A0A5N5D7R0_9PEZI|nr:Nonribosomal peptide synthetase 4 [Lasiodiplodia theobromae]